MKICPALELKSNFIFTGAARPRRALSTAGPL
jgi:hypothetical protein